MIATYLFKFLAKLVGMALFQVIAEKRPAKGWLYASGYSLGLIAKNARNFAASRYKRTPGRPR